MLKDSIKAIKTGSYRRDQRKDIFGKLKVKIYILYFKLLVQPHKNPSHEERHFACTILLSFLYKLDTQAVVS